VSASDLFGDRAREYARYRPTYPAQLFDHLEGLVEERERAWDCGAGSGQTARSLALRFAQVVATDVSERQLAQADSAERVAFVAATAEAVPMRERCVDLVTVSAAVHWFDRPLFYDEVRRVTRPGGVLAVWSYYHSQIEPAIDQVLERFEQVVASYWPTRFDLNRNLYRDLDLPFERLPWPVLHAEAHMRLPDLMNYLRTWSASQGYERSEGRDPVASVRAELEGAWGDPEKERVVRWPLHGAVGRIG